MATRKSGRKRTPKDLDLLDQLTSGVALVSSRQVDSCGASAAQKPDTKKRGKGDSAVAAAPKPKRPTYTKLDLNTILSQGNSFGFSQPPSTNGGASPSCTNPPAKQTTKLTPSDEATDKRRDSHEGDLHPFSSDSAKNGKNGKKTVRLSTLDSSAPNGASKPTPGKPPLVPRAARSLKLSREKSKGLAPSNQEEGAARRDDGMAAALVTEQEQEQEQVTLVPWENAPGKEEDEEDEDAEFDQGLQNVLEMGSKLQELLTGRSGWEDEGGVDHRQALFETGDGNPSQQRGGLDRGPFLYTLPLSSVFHPPSPELLPQHKGPPPALSDSQVEEETRSMLSAGVLVPYLEGKRRKGKEGEGQISSSLEVLWDMVMVPTLAMGTPWEDEEWDEECIEAGDMACDTLCALLELGFSQEHDKSALQTLFSYAAFQAALRSMGYCPVLLSQDSSVARTYSSSNQSTSLPEGETQKGKEAQEPLLDVEPQIDTCLFTMCGNGTPSSSANEEVSSSVREGGTCKASQTATQSTAVALVPLVQLLRIFLAADEGEARASQRARDSHLYKTTNDTTVVESEQQKESKSKKNDFDKDTATEKTRALSALTRASAAVGSKKSAQDSASKGSAKGKGKEKRKSADQVLATPASNASGSAGSSRRSKRLAGETANEETDSALTSAKTSAGSGRGLKRLTVETSEKEAGNTTTPTETKTPTGKSKSSHDQRSGSRSARAAMPGATQGRWYLRLTSAWSEKERAGMLLHLLRLLLVPELQGAPSQPLLNSSVQLLLSSLISGVTGTEGGGEPANRRLPSLLLSLPQPATHGRSPEKPEGTQKPKTEIPRDVLFAGLQLLLQMPQSLTAGSSSTIQLAPGKLTESWAHCQLECALALLTILLPRKDGTNTVSQVMPNEATGDEAPGPITAKHLQQALEHVQSKGCKETQILKELVQRFILSAVLSANQETQKALKATDLRVTLGVMLLIDVAFALIQLSAGTRRHVSESDRLQSCSAEGESIDLFSKWLQKTSQLPISDPRPDAPLLRLLAAFLSNRYRQRLRTGVVGFDN